MVRDAFEVTRRDDNHATYIDGRGNSWTFTTDT